MKKFRVPRKIKKKLKWTIWFYPMDPIDNTYLVAWPYRLQEDYNAYKKGELHNPLAEYKKKHKEK